MTGCSARSATRSFRGGLGDDVLNGGIGDDIAVGGVIDMAFRGGSPIDITTFDLDGQLQQGITIAVENLADGDDSISGLGGRDILIGGGRRRHARRRGRKRHPSG